MLSNEQQKIYNTKIIESAKLFDQLITIFLNATYTSHKNSTYCFKVKSPMWHMSPQYFHNLFYINLYKKCIKIRSSVI